MKKGLLLAILAMIASVTLVGCGQKSEEQTPDDSSNTIATEEQKSEDNSEQQSTEEQKDEQTGQQQDNSDNAQNDNPTMDLGDKTIDGESVEGTIYGTGKYRLTNGSDRIVEEWVKDNAKNKIEYIFENDKLSAVKVTATYENEGQAKATFDAINKNENSKKGLKDIKLEGSNIVFYVEESQWEQYKEYSKDKVFEEQKKALEELSKVDDIKSDD